MPNKTWLTTAATRSTFPSLREPGYDSKKHTIAGAAWAVPLLWLPLFRTGDLVVEDVMVENGITYRDPAPVVETEVALARLVDSLGALNRAFRDQGPLDRHVALLRKAIAAAGRPFVTLEPHEVARMAGEPSDFYQRLERALAFFEVPERKQRRTDLLQVTPAVSEDDLPFPHPDKFFDREGYEVEEAEMIHFLLGEAWLRPLPWDSRCDTGS